MLMVMLNRWSRMPMACLGKSQYFTRHARSTVLNQVVQSILLLALVGLQMCFPGLVLTE